MAKVSEILTGIFVGIVIWFVLTVIFTLFALIPLIGWLIWILGLFIVPIVAGYIAGRLGGGMAAIGLALIAPVLAAVIGFYALSLIPIAVIRQFLGIAWGTIVAIWAIFNLIFVGAGGAIGNAARPKPQEPVKVEVHVGEKPTSVSVTKERVKPIEVLPEETISTKLERKTTETDILVKKRILGYVIAYRKVELKALASRFNLSRDQVEEIILEHIADGKIRGTIDPEKDTFTLEA